MPLPGLELPGRVSTKNKNMNPETNQTAESPANVPVVSEAPPVNEKGLTNFTLVDFPVYLIRAISLFASTDPSRYILQTVHFEWHNGQTVIVATDGRCLGAYLTGPFEHEQPRYEPFNLPITWFKHFPVKIGTTSTQVNIHIDLNQTTWSVENPVLGISVGGRDNTISCAFPRWRSVVPDEKKEAIPASTWVFAPKLMGKFGQFAKAIGLKTGNDALHIVHHSSAGPWSVYLRDKHFYGVLMPVRSDGNPKVPHWAIL